MSTPKHAPGPWTAQDLAIVASDRSFVGRVYPWCADPQDAECAKANARLIAAAPELLVALRNLLSAYEKPDQLICCNGHECGCMGFSVYQEAEHYAYSAIDKATGESA